MKNMLSNLMTAHISESFLLNMYAAVHILNKIITYLARVEENLLTAHITEVLSPLYALSSSYRFRQVYPWILKYFIFTLIFQSIYKSSFIPFIPTDNDNIS